MKDWNFIERLSAYLDGELPREQVALLEEELRSDPAKMRMYRQQLRLDRGSEVLCKAIEAQSARPHFNVENTVIWVPKTLAPRRSWLPAWGGQLAAGGVAAAAALGVYLFPWSAPEAGQPGATAVVLQDLPRVAPENVYVVSEGGLGRLGQRFSAQRDVYRLDSWGRLVRMEVSTELPGVPADLPGSAVATGTLRAMELSAPAPMAAGYTGGRVGAGWASPAFATYEFQR